MKKTHNSFKKLFSLSLAAVTLTAAMNLPALSVKAYAESPETDDVPDAYEYQLADSIQEGTILHCFCWSYEEITENLPLIAKSGFTSIQVSPAQGSGFADSPWYYAYDPWTFEACDEYPYDRDSLKTLCDEADKYGINIIMDIIANHLNKEALAEYNESLLADEYWHEYHKIKSYTDRFQITDGSLDGLHDLNTENKYIQELVYNYTQQLKELGVDGIRWDAAKHIALPSEGSDFWTVVTDNGLYNYGEILTGPTDDKNHDELMAEYTEYMSVTDSNYGNSLTGFFNRGTAPTIEGNWTGRGVTADKLLYWGESHDTYSNDGQFGGTNFMEQNVIDRAYAVAAAREGATSLYFSRPFETEKDRIRNGLAGSKHFSSPEISAINHFHNAMTGKKDCYAVTDNVSVVTRENGGAVIVCGSGSGEVCVENAGSYVKPGVYKDEVSGNTFTVTEDTITGTVSECGIAVVYDTYYIGRLYINSDIEFEFYDTLDITLHSRDMISASYTLKQAYYTYRDDSYIPDVTEIVDTADFSNGDILTLHGFGFDEAYYLLTLSGVSENGRHISEKYEFYHSIYNRSYPSGYNTPGSITFDNLRRDWKEVYVYAYDDSSGTLITNGDKPGQPMTKCSQDYFRYQLPEQFDGCNNIHLVFTNENGEAIDKTNYYDEKDIITYYSAYCVFTFYDSLRSNCVGLIGDFYSDGKINTRDALEVLRCSLNLGDFHGHWFIADANQDENINAKDSLLIQRYSLKLPSDDNIGKPYLFDFLY